MHVYVYVAGFRIAKLWTVPKPFSWPHVSENISLGLWPGTCVKCGQIINFFAGEINLSYPSIEVKSDHPPCWEICPDMASDQLWRHKSRWNNPFLQLLWGHVSILGQWPIFFYQSFSARALCFFSLSFLDFSSQYVRAVAHGLLLPQNPKDSRIPNSKQHLLQYSIRNYSQWLTG